MIKKNKHNADRVIQNSKNSFQLRKKPNETTKKKMETQIIRKVDDTDEAAKMY